MDSGPGRCQGTRRPPKAPHEHHTSIRNIAGMMASAKPSGAWGWRSSDELSLAVSGPRLPAAQHHHPVTGLSLVPAGLTFSRTSRQKKSLARASCACGRLALGEASRPTRSMPFRGESWGAGTIDKTSGASHGKAMRLATSDGQTMILRCAGECVRGRRGRLSDANASDSARQHGSLH